MRKNYDALIPNFRPKFYSSSKSGKKKTSKFINKIITYYLEFQILVRPKSIIAIFI